MQLKLQRSQREGGLIGKTILFCLDARVEFASSEAANIRRYKLQDQLIYSSEAARNAAAGSAVSAANARAGRLSIDSVDDLMFSAASKMGHGLKAAALGALASLKLTVTISSLERGHHIECKSLDELLGAEEAIMDACRSLKGYLETAATFDGREVLIDFSTDEPAIVASAPAPMLVAPELHPVLIPTFGPSPSITVSAPLRAQSPVYDHSIEDRILRAFRALRPEQRKALLWVGVGLVLFLVFLVMSS